MTKQVKSSKKGRARKARQPSERAAKKAGSVLGHAKNGKPVSVEERSKSGRTLSNARWQGVRARAAAKAAQVEPRSWTLSDNGKVVCAPFAPSAAPVIGASPSQVQEPAESGWVAGVILFWGIMGMVGTGGLLYRVLAVLTDGLGLFGVMGLLGAEFVGGHFMIAAKGWLRAVGITTVAICMSTEVFLAVDREDMVSRHEAHIASQQTTSSEAMEQCVPRVAPKEYGSTRLPQFQADEQIRMDKCNARNAGRADRADKKAETAADKAGKRGWFELCSLIGLALACSLGTSLASGALTGFVRACKRS